MTVTYDIRAEIKKSTAALKNILSAMGGVQKVSVNKRADRITVKYDGGVTSIGQIRGRIEKTGFRPAHELRGGTFERMGAILALYQKNRQVFL